MCNTWRLCPSFFHVYFWLFTFWCHFFFVFVLASCSCVPAASFGPVLLVFRDQWAVSPLQLCQKRAEFHWTVYWPLVYTSHSLQINIRGMEMEAEGERAELQWRKTLSHFPLVIIKSPKITKKRFFPPRFLITWQQSADMTNSIWSSLPFISPERGSFPASCGSVLLAATGWLSWRPQVDAVIYLRCKQRVNL